MSIYIILTYFVDCYKKKIIGNIKNKDKEGISEMIYKYSLLYKIICLKRQNLSTKKFKEFGKNKENRENASLMIFN